MKKEVELAVVIDIGERGAAGAEGGASQDGARLIRKRRLSAGGAGETDDKRRRK